MKPLAAADRLRRIAARLAAGEPLDELQRAWLGLAIVRRLQDAESDLDALLGLRSRRGGRLSACSKQPARDQALRELAGTVGTIKSRATALQMRVIAWKAGAADADLDAIASRFGDPPHSLRQLQRIVGGSTEAARLAEATGDENLASDLSSQPGTARCRHQPDRSAAPCN